MQTHFFQRYIQNESPNHIIYYAWFFCKNVKLRSCIYPTYCPSHHSIWSNTCMWKYIQNIKGRYVENIKIYIFIYMNGFPIKNWKRAGREKKSLLLRSIYDHNPFLSCVVSLYIRICIKREALSSISKNCFMLFFDNSYVLLIRYSIKLP